MESKKVNKIFGVITIVYIILYTGYIISNLAFFPFDPTGEWDDYMYQTSSIIYQHDFNINDDDRKEFKKLFPEAIPCLEYLTPRFSDYKDSNGDEIPWYFPTYSAACVPLVLLCKWSGIAASSGFTLTNIVALISMLIFVFAALKTNAPTKFIIILLLSINPIVFYINWQSCEVMLYSLIGITMVCWYNKWYRSAALAVSVCGSMNPTIMAVGIVMIIEYLAVIGTKKPKEISWIRHYTSHLKDILIYGCCYLFSLVPFAYNYILTGHFNLTASCARRTSEISMVFKRMLAYLFDLNFGILPYYSAIFIISLILLIPAFLKKRYRYILMMFSFFLTMFAYSFMFHINCGMSGIARYNAWSAVIMIFAVCTCLDKIVTLKSLNTASKAALAVNILLIHYITYSYNIYRASYYSCYENMPIAAIVLDYAPALYNPLHSTFNCRVNRIDGGYSYSTPITYCNSDNEIRKILATASDKEKLLNSVTGSDEDIRWFTKQLDKLTDEESYINVSPKHDLKFK